MNVFVIAINCIFITTIYANFNVTYQIPNGTIPNDTHKFELIIDRGVNKPMFSSYIQIHKNVTLENLVYEFDVNAVNNSNITYVNKTLTFYTPESFVWNKSIEYYITFDEGVLYSDSESNSTAKVNPKFWHFQIVPDSTSSETTASLTTTPNSNGSSDVTSTTESSSTLPTLPKGEPSPTRSAQLGMGLGITLIGIFIIGEIIYFNYFYRDGLRSSNYRP